MDNTPEMAFQLGAAGLGTHVAVGLNTTRRGEALLADIRKADCQVVVADPGCCPCSRASTSAAYGWCAATSPRGRTPCRRAGHPAGRDPGPDSLFMLIFTSGTSGDPKAVRITHEKVTYPGAYLIERLGLGRTTSSTSRCRCSTPTR